MTKEKLIKLCNVFAPTEQYYTFAHWASKDIDGVSFLPVVKEPPSQYKTQTMHYMRKDSLKEIK
jgi:hypothetical protein